MLFTEAHYPSLGMAGLHGGGGMGSISNDPVLAFEEMMRNGACLSSMYTPDACKAAADKLVALANNGTIIANETTFNGGSGTGAMWLYAGVDSSTPKDSTTITAVANSLASAVGLDHVPVHNTLGQSGPITGPITTAIQSTSQPTALSLGSNANVGATSTVQGQGGNADTSITDMVSGMMDGLSNTQMLIGGVAIVGLIMFMSKGRR